MIFAKAANDVCGTRRRERAAAAAARRGVLVSVDAAMRGAVPGENGTLVASFLNDTTGWNASMPVRCRRWGAHRHAAGMPASLLCA
jgi:hypothetical protein